MGCCLSSNSNTHHPKRSNLLHAKPKKHQEKKALTPPPLSLRETVKEVLSSETPKHLNFTNKLKTNREQDMQKTNKTTKITTDEISDVTTIATSDICSLNDSVSVSSTTVCTSRDDTEVFRQAVHKVPARFRSRSFSGGIGARRERTVRKCPEGRVHGGSVKMVRGSHKPGRPDAGERLRSPVKRVGGGYVRSDSGRSFPSRRRVSASPGRVSRKMPERSRKVGEGSRESLENPLVSLECFIFL